MFIYFNNLILNGIHRRFQNLEMSTTYLKNSNLFQDFELIFIILKFSSALCFLKYF